MPTPEIHGPNTSSGKDTGDDPRRHAPSTLRNREAILPVLIDHLPTRGRVLEIASGTGEHAAFFAPRLPDGLVWQPTDRDPSALAGIDGYAADSGCPRIEPARTVDVSHRLWAEDLSADAIFCANMIHIAPWIAALGLMAGAGRLLSPGAPLLLYGPFRRDGRHTGEGNVDFDRSLKQRDPGWGIRDLEGEILPAAQQAGLALRAAVAMPANNLIVVLERQA